MLIRASRVKAAHGLWLLLPGRGLEKLAPCLAWSAWAVCNFAATFVSEFNLVFHTKPVYVDVCRFDAEMDVFQRKWVFP